MTNTDHNKINIPNYSEDDTEAAGGEDIYGADGDADTTEKDEREIASEETTSSGGEADAAADAPGSSSQ